MKRQYPNAPDRIYYNPDTSIEIEGKIQHTKLDADMQCLTYVSTDVIKETLLYYTNWLIDYDPDKHSDEDYKFHTGAFEALTRLLKKATKP